MILSDPAGITLKGEIGESLDKSLRHLQRLNTEEMWREFDAPDEIWHWGADYPGRWIATMGLLGRYTGKDYGVKGAADRLIGYQQPDGSFGDYSAPFDYKEWFGMGRGLVGLLEYFQATDDTCALDAARRLGDYYVEHYPRYTPYMYECYSNALEGLVLLAKLTDDARYLDLAREMAETSMVYQRVWQSNTLSPQGRRAPCGGQVHCQLMAARGLLDLAEYTDDPKYVAAVLSLHHNICERTH
jgi:rhamnogalacturonyl hydrolase YesR